MKKNMQDLLNYLLLGWIFVMGSFIAIERGLSINGRYVHDLFILICGNQQNSTYDSIWRLVYLGT